MKKNDRLIIVFGIISIIVCGIIILTYSDDQTKYKAAELDEIIDITGVVKDTPDSIIVSDISVIRI